MDFYFGKSKYHPPREMHILICKLCWEYLRIALPIFGSETTANFKRRGVANFNAVAVLEFCRTIRNFAELAGERVVSGTNHHFWWESVPESVRQNLKSMKSSHPSSLCAGSFWG